MLKRLIGNSPINIFIDDVGELALGIFIESFQTKVKIINNVMMGSDKDDYPKFEVELAQESLASYKELCTGKKVENIAIIKDTVTWQYNGDKWSAIMDVGIKIIFDDHELLLVALDTLAGLIQMVILKNPSEVNKCLEEYWSMKTENIKSLKREEILIN